MAQTEAQQKAIKKYQAKLQRIYVWLSPEQKERIVAHTQKKGESINAFVQRAIMETIDRENEEK